MLFPHGPRSPEHLPLGVDVSPGPSEVDPDRIFSVLFLFRRRQDTEESLGDNDPS